MVAISSDTGSATTASSDATSLLIVDVQCAIEDNDGEEPPGSESLNGWAQAAYIQVGTQPAEVSIRLVGEAEMVALNKRYRGQDRSTNVLSFGFDVEPELAQQINQPLLGDVVICHSVILTEAQQQQKTTADHYAHMVTHGILHVCGYDHQDEQSAIRMEALETQILAGNGIADPYNPTSLN